MTFAHCVTHGQRLQLHFWPVLAWIVIGMALFSIAAFVSDMLSSGRPFSVGIGVGLGTLLAFALFVFQTVGQPVFCRFDAERDRLSIWRLSLRGPSYTERQLSEVVGVTARVLRRAYCQIELQLASGERLRLTPYYYTAFSTYAVDQLGRFLQQEPQVQLVTRTSRQGLP
jgi:hypothetical protein